MGCCCSSPHAKRRYRDPADLDEVVIPLRHFGTYRVGSNLIPDDIAGLPSTHIRDHLASNLDDILYEAEIDHGSSWRFFRPLTCCAILPLIEKIIHIDKCACDQACCWLRKEYSTRTFFRIYPNRIEYNNPSLRFFGLFGCGSWNADKIITNPFDRGAFGFTNVRGGVLSHFLCCCWPVYGGVVARHRCQCNGPLWNRMCTDCGGWWCDEWLCQLCFCTYRYEGLAYPDEVAFASSIALQAYFEGRAFTKLDMENCLEFWRSTISERHDPIGRKRSVCCEPYYVPIPTCTRCYQCTHSKRNIPYDEEIVTNEVKEVYDRHETERIRQIQAYKDFYGPVQNSTVCRCGNCRQFWGRKGCCFCTESCCYCKRRKAGEPAPPPDQHFCDDDWDASSVLLHVIGSPPANVVLKRWKWDPERGVYNLQVIPETCEVEGEKQPTSRKLISGMW